MEDEWRFWSSDFCDPGGIDTDLSVLIGDFGLGSDAPILLDHRADLESPRVLRLLWSPQRPFDPRNDKWVSFADSLESFLRLIVFDRGRFSGV